MAKIRIGIFAMVILLGSLLSGCDLVQSILGGGKADVLVKSVEPLKDSSGVLAGVRIVFSNIGGTDAPNVGYTICLTTDTTVSMATDPVIYRSSLNLAANQDGPVDLGDEIGTWMDTNNFDYNSISADVQYYIGVIVDPDKRIDEANETNNEGVTTTSFLMGPGGGTSAISVSGTLVLPANLVAPNWDFLANKSYTIYVGATPSSFTGSGTSAIVPQDAFVQGWTTMSKVYDPANGSSYPFTFTVPSTGDYQLIAFLDENADGNLNLISTDTPPSEPFGVVGGITQSGIPITTISGPMSNQTLGFVDMSVFGWMAMGPIAVSGQVNPSPTTTTNVTGVVYVAAVQTAALVDRTDLVLDTSDSNVVAAFQSFDSLPTGPAGGWPGQQTYDLSCATGGYLNIIAFVDENGDGILTFDSSGNPNENAVGFIPKDSAQWIVSGPATGPNLYDF